MGGMTCDVTGCKWNDGTGSCSCDGIYISDAETGEPMCERRVSRRLTFSCRLLSAGEREKL